jgi:hypothetical protein
MGRGSGPDMAALTVHPERKKERGKEKEEERKEEGKNDSLWPPSPFSALSLA